MLLDKVIHETFGTHRQIHVGTADCQVELDTPVVDLEGLGKLPAFKQAITYCAGCVTDR